MLHIMKRKLTTFFVFGLVLALCHPSSSAEPPDAGQKLEELGSAMKGAAGSTRRRVLEDFRKDLDGTVVSFTGTVWTLSSIDLTRDRADGPGSRPALYSWEYQGILVRDDQTSDASPNERAISRLGGTDKATLIIVRSGKYQLYAVTASPTIVDTVRQGAPITIEAQITGLRENSFLGFVTTVMEATVTMKCPNGHQLPEGHDYLFCPYCGEALK